MRRVDLGFSPLLRAALLLALCTLPTVARADPPCPAAKDLPQLSIDNIRKPAVPVVDAWQIFWGDVPLSDAQLAMLAKRDPLIDITREEMKDRGMWVYIGLGTAAIGTAVSSVGWVLYGQNEVDSEITLPLAIGGLVVGLGGVLATSEWIQTPLEPHLAPTPRHRLTRDEARILVESVNRRLYRDICAAATPEDKTP